MMQDEALGLFKTLRANFKHVSSIKRRKKLDDIHRYGFIKIYDGKKCTLEYVLSDKGERQEGKLRTIRLEPYENVNDGFRVLFIEYECPDGHLSTEYTGKIYDYVKKSEDF